MESAGIIIKNAKVVNPVKESIDNQTIYIKGKHIVEPFEMSECVHVIDAKDCFVFPGLVDHHTHVFYGGSNIAVKPDWLIPYGVTAMADAGTAGCANYDNYYLLNVLPSAITVKTYLNVFAGGQLAVTIDEDFCPNLCDSSRIKDIVARHRDNIVGFKIRFSRGIFPDGEESLTWLKCVYQLIDEVDPTLSLCIHVTDSPVPVEEFIPLMRKGDIFCHCYHGKGNTILDENKKVHQAVWDAKKRGVIFDVANGRSGFGFEVAEQAFKEGLLPDIISTDTTKANFNTPGYTTSLLFLISKFVLLGMSLPAAVKAATYTPAQVIGETKRGGVDVGMMADLVIVKEVQQETQYLDVFGAERVGNSYFDCKTTIINGEVLYRANGF